MFGHPKQQPKGLSAVLLPPSATIPSNRPRISTPVGPKATSVSPDPNEVVEVDITIHFFFCPKGGSPSATNLRWFVHMCIKSGIPGWFALENIGGLFPPQWSCYWRHLEEIARNRSATLAYHGRTCSSCYKQVMIINLWQKTFILNSNRMLPRTEASKISTKLFHQLRWFHVTCDMPKHLEAASASSALIVARTMHRKTVPRNLGGKALAARRAPWSEPVPWWTATFYIYFMGIKHVGRRDENIYKINERKYANGKVSWFNVNHFSTWGTGTVSDVQTSMEKLHLSVSEQSVQEYQGKIGQSGTCEMTPSSRTTKSSFTKLKLQKHAIRTSFK